MHDEPTVDIRLYSIQMLLLVNPLVSLDHYLILGFPNKACFGNAPACFGCCPHMCARTHSPRHQNNHSLSLHSLHRQQQFFNYDVQRPLFKLILAFPHGGPLILQPKACEHLV